MQFCLKCLFKPQCSEPGTCRPLWSLTHPGTLPSQHTNPVPCVSALWNRETLVHKCLRVYLSWSICSHLSKCKVFTWIMSIMLMVMAVTLLIQQMLWKKEKQCLSAAECKPNAFGLLRCCMAKGKNPSALRTEIWFFFSLKKHFYDFFFFKHAIYKVSLCFQEQQITLKHFHCKHLLLSCKEVKSKMQTCLMALPIQCTSL